jgi:hypothetical protein
MTARKGGGLGSAATDLEARETVGIGNAAVSKASPRNSQAALPISGIVVGEERFRRDIGDLGPLAASMVELGLLQPIVVRPDGVLIAGERRLRAAELLGWTDIAVNVVDLDQIARGEYAENTFRKDFRSRGRRHQASARAAGEGGGEGAHAGRQTLGQLAQGSRR